MVRRPPTVARLIVADPRLKADQKAKDRYRALVTIAGFFALAILGFLVARMTNYPTLSQTMNAELDDELFTGTIRTNPDDKRECREQFFDNRSGKMTMPEPCGLRTFNGKAPRTPSNSLAAIRKAFSNQ
jgi:hypothetical protein